MKHPKHYDKMNTRELAAATREFDKPFVMDRGRPLNPAERRQHRVAARRRGRPKIGEGSARISLTLERALLRAADAFARRHRLKRSQLFAQGLRLLICQDRGAV